MGGLAIKKIIGREPDRFTNEEYQLAIKHFSELITFYQGEYKIPMSYTGKTSHGDLDILVAMNVETKDTLLKTFDYVKNNNVYSLAYHTNTKTFQVDLTFFDVQDPYYHWKMNNLYNYMSHGNFGNILGKVLDGYSFQWSGERGLIYQVRKGHFMDCKTYDEYNIVIGQIELDVGFDTMLHWLGLDYKVWQAGFVDNKAASEYIATSPMFDSKFFDISKFKHADRVRTSKRNAYEDIQKIQQTSEFTRCTLILDIKNKLYSCRSILKNIEDVIKNYIYEHTISEKYKTFVNGVHISVLTGRTGEELGKLCKLIRKCYPPVPYAICTDKEEWDERIMYHHHYMENHPEEYKDF